MYIKLHGTIFSEWASLLVIICIKFYMIVASVSLCPHVLILTPFWSRRSGLKELIFWPKVHKPMRTTDWFDHNTANACLYLDYRFVSHCHMHWQMSMILDGSSNLPFGSFSFLNTKLKKNSCRAELRAQTLRYSYACGEIWSPPRYKNIPATPSITLTQTEKYQGVFHSV